MEKSSETLEKWRRDMREYLSEFFEPQCSGCVTHTDVLRNLFTTACKDIRLRTTCVEPHPNMDVDNDTADKVWKNVDEALCQSRWQASDTVLERLESINQIFDKQKEQKSDDLQELPYDLLFEPTIADLKRPIREAISCKWSLSDRMRYLPMMTIPRSPKRGYRKIISLEQIMKQYEKHDRIQLKRSVYDKLCQFEKMMINPPADSSGSHEWENLEQNAMQFSVEAKKYMPWTWLDDEEQQQSEQESEDYEKVDIEALELQLRSSDQSDFTGLTSVMDICQERSPCGQPTSSSSFSGISSISMNLDFSELGDNSHLLIAEREDMEERKRRSNAPSPSSKRIYSSVMDDCLCDIRQKGFTGFISPQPLVKTEEVGEEEKEERLSSTHHRPLPEQLLDTRGLLQRMAINQQQNENQKSPLLPAERSSPSSSKSNREEKNGGGSSSNGSIIQKKKQRRMENGQRHPQPPPSAQMLPLFSNGSMIKNNFARVATTSAHLLPDRPAAVATSTVSNHHNRFSASSRVDDFISLRRTTQMTKRTFLTAQQGIQPRKHELNRMPSFHFADKQQIE